MSTVSQTPKIDVALPLNETIMRLIGIAALVIALVLIVSAGAVTAPSATRPFDYNGYMLYRQGEWKSVPFTLDNAEGYRIFRLGEVVSPLTPAEAYLLHRQGEWVSIPAPEVNLSVYFESERTLVNSPTDLTAYHLSERMMTSPQNDLSAYHQSERTLIDPAAGMTLYLQSERTYIPARDLSAFNAYQRSEWFGE
jgi:hypothetical protein